RHLDLGGHEARPFGLIQLAVELRAQRDRLAAYRDIGREQVQIVIDVLAALDDQRGERETGRRRPQNSRTNVERPREPAGLDVPPSRHASPATLCQSDSTPGVWR